MARPGWVYFAYNPETHRCKIGWTTNNPKDRFSCSTDTPGALNVWGMLLSRSDHKEKVLHEHFKYLRVKGEWFAVDEALREFVQWHTYKTIDDVRCQGWSDTTWKLWERLEADEHVREILRITELNPIEIVRRSPDVLLFFYHAIKPHIVNWVGFEAKWRKDEFFESSTAYDLVYDMCIDLLPV